MGSSAGVPAGFGRKSSLLVGALLVFCRQTERGATASMGSTMVYLILRKKVLMEGALRGGPQPGRRVTRADVFQALPLLLAHNVPVEHLSAPESLGAAVTAADSTAGHLAINRLSAPRVQANHKCHLTSQKVSPINITQEI